MQNWYSFNLNVMATYVNVQSSFICLNEDKSPSGAQISRRHTVGFILLFVSGFIILIKG